MCNDLIGQIRENFSDERLKNLDDKEMLAFLLSYGTRQKNLEEIAGKLIARFGSLSEVLEAPVGQLMAVGGLSENAAVLVSMIPQICGICLMDRADKQVIQGKAQVIQFASQCFIGRTSERFLAVCLDAAETVVGYELLTKGTVDWAGVDLRRIMSMLMDTQAVGLLVAHNHPRGVPIPSVADKNVTKCIANAVVPLGITFLDHVIFGVKDYLCMAEMPDEYGKLFLPD